MGLMEYLPGVQESVGCTEPAALALATSLAFKAVGGEIQRIWVKCDAGVIKNTYNVGVVGFDNQSGVNGGLLAAALGAIGGSPDARLAVLNNISESDVGRAQTLVEGGKVLVSQHEQYTSDVYIDARVHTDKGMGRTLITQHHTNVVAVECNGHPIALPGWVNQPYGNHQHASEVDWQNMSLEDIWDFASDCSAEDRAFLLSGAEMNLTAAEFGLQEQVGLGIGAAMQASIAMGLLSDDLDNRIAMLAAAASDARMSGKRVPVMTSGYSGNQGLVATLPVLVLAREHRVGDVELACAIAISQCTVAYVKSFMGNLSPFCNAVLAASMGAASGIIYLLGGSAECAARAISIIVANSAGAICDGAKPGCAIKVGTGASQALKTALLALSGVAPSVRDGIVGPNPAETLRSLARLGNIGMKQIEREVLNMMMG